MKNGSCPISGTVYSKIGGQAVLEGVMMRNEDDYAVAVRRADGEIVVKKDVYHGIINNKTVYKIPVIRGVLSFIDSLVLGLSTLNFSSDIYIASEEEKEKAEAEKAATDIDGENKAKENEHSNSGTRADGENGNAEKRESDGKSDNGRDKETGAEASNTEKRSAKDAALSAGVTILALILALGLFMVLPYFASLLFKPLVGEGIALSLIEGLIRILIFVGYIRVISLMEDIRRVFMYHGAEHKCINCIEAGYPLTVENVRQASREHRRCGTSFLLYVMVISIIFFAFIQTDVRWIKIVMRLVLIPAIAGVSYEFIRLAGRSEGALIKLISKPGLWLQKLTTREPDDEMIKVGIRSVEEVFDWKAFLKENFPDDK